MIFSLKSLLYERFYDYEKIKHQKSVNGFLEYCRKCEKNLL